ncbi:uncharacterized protein STEHIDRAFT_94487 [Stereum hirsutum FP-91666 SS1]|uniref:uncharacterized protein n=1 Tax=Stereum hirsutum (strain FP-91666) TaxID=721885 RepID=UPI000440FFF7|nr:uncharacterized protein STEHIDRAFT_94487 [Stereum hirsutum FP-91666 SS1]EIM89333.1 hypothetical protein STEHIDRAFT_94487 [Stereum hirsutum FP-91666 SS1]
MDVDPFAQAAEGKHGGDYIEYRNMGWIKAGALIMAETIALGILSFPKVFYRLGMFGGIFTTIALAALSWQTGYVIVQFKVNHPGVMNFADAGGVVAGRKGFWLLGAMLVTKSVFVAGSHALSGAIALNNISSGAICNIAWAAIIAIVSFLLTIPRTFEKVSYISFVSVTAILTACFITIVATGIQSDSDLPDFPDNGAVRWKAFENHGFTETINAITNIVFAYGGHVAIFSFVAEMKNPADFKYSLGLVQIVATTFYVVVGATIYSFGGQYVTSPALTMTSKPVLAFVNTVIAGVIASYVAAKFIFLTLFRSSRHLTSRSWKTWGMWAAICAAIWIAGFVIAEVIPFFSDLLSVISSILTIWFTYGLSGVLWLYDNGPKGPAGDRTSYAGYWSSRSRLAMFLTSVFVIIMSAVIMVLGLYSSIKSIADNYASGAYSHPFSCSS